MKYICTLAMCCIVINAMAQRNNRFDNRSNDKVYEAKYMQKPPLFPPGRDSLRNFYFNHFPAFDTVLQLAVKKGDTAKYLRIYFSFNIDEQGYVYDTEFERVASTRSATTEGAKLIAYFLDIRSYLNQAVKQMLDKMPAWKPGLQSGRPVRVHCEDFLQFWVGLTPPQ